MIGSKTWGVLRVWYGKSWVQWLLAAAFFFGVSSLFLAPSFASCSLSTPAFNSDSTGGTAWFEWASGDGLFWHRTNKSNYPIGEDLNRPQFIASEAYTFPYRVFASLTSPICGLNLMILLGYMSSALVMFGFVRWLFDRSSIALFAGFAAAFVPYHQLKSTSHIVYMFSAGFIAIVWIYLWLRRAPTLPRIGIFAVVTAVTMYMDGYFLIIAAITAAALFGFDFLAGVVAVLRKQQSARSFLAWWRYPLLFGVMLAALLTPVLYVQKTQQSTIKQSLSTARGNIKSDATSYAIRPIEFLLPYSGNPLLPAGYKAWRLSPQVLHNSNENENTLFVGYTVLLLAAAAILAMSKRGVREKLLPNGESYAMVVCLTLFVAVICFVFALPYRAYLFHHVVHTPETLIVKLTANWRVFARFFLVLHPLFVTMAAAGLYLLSRRLNPKWFFMIVILCIGLTAVEYRTPLLFYRGNLAIQTPDIYKAIRDDKSVAAIAEYPLLSLLNQPSEFTFQQLHGKPLLNANDTAIQMSPIDQSIAGLGDPQTLGVLKERGISVVTYYGTDISRVPGLVMYCPADLSTRPLDLSPIYSYRIDKAVAPLQAMLVRVTGFDQALLDKAQHTHNVLAQHGTVEVMPTLPRESISGAYAVSFKAGAYGISNSGLTVEQGGKVLWQGQVSSNTPVEFTASANMPIELAVTAPIDVTYMRAAKQ